jgi:hypothetical protein
MRLRRFGRCPDCKNVITTLAASGCRECGKGTNSVYHRCDECALSKNSCVLCDNLIDSSLPWGTDVSNILEEK